MKKSKNIVLIVTPVLSAALLNACGGSSQPRTIVNATTPATPVTTPYPVSTVAPEAAQTRDVYNNLNDCVKDWGNKELCEQMGDDDDRDYRSRYRTGGTGRYFYGPKYSSSNRIITYKGKSVTPTGKVTKLPSYVSAVPASKTTSSTVPTSKTTTGTTSSSSSTTSSSSSSSTLPSTTSKSTTSTTSPSSTTSSTSSTSTYTPYSSSSTTRSGFGGGSSSYSSSSSSGS